MKQPRVLVVDSDQQVRGVLKELFEERGFTVDEAATRELAFDLLDANSPELLILDDPCAERTYRVVWLREDQADTRVELIDLHPEAISQQFSGLMDQRSVA